MRRKQAALLEWLSHCHLKQCGISSTASKPFSGYEEASLRWHLSMLDNILAAQH